MLTTNICTFAINGQIEQALSAWCHAFQQTPYDAIAHASVAIGYLLIDQQDEALRYLEQAIYLDQSWRQRLSVDIRWTDVMLRHIDAWI